MACSVALPVGAAQAAGHGIGATAGGVSAAGGRPHRVEQRHLRPAVDHQSAQRPGRGPRLLRQSVGRRRLGHPGRGRVTRAHQRTSG